MLVIVEDSREILAVYENTDDIRTNNLKEEELSRAKILCFKFSQLMYKVIFRNETFHSDLCDCKKKPGDFSNQVLAGSDLDQAGRAMCMLKGMD